MKFFSVLDSLLRPRSWPVFWRRAFLLTFPVSLPVWLVIWLFSCAAIVVCIVILLPAWLFWSAFLEPMWRASPATDRKEGEP
jgi:hypothetical protein